MMPRSHCMLLMRLASVAVVTLLCACAGGLPAEQFYTLTTPMTEARSPGKAPRPDALAVSIGAINLPEQVDRPQIVTLDGQQRITISEQHRWAASLKAQIAQVLASGLARRLDTPLVTAYPQPESRLPDVRISLAVQRFDAQPGQEVFVDALWSIRTMRADQVVSGRASVHAPIAKASDDYAAIAAAYRAALEQITEQVAEEVRSIRQSK